MKHQAGDIQWTSNKPKQQGLIEIWDQTPQNWANNSQISHNDWLQWDQLNQLSKKIEAKTLKSHVRTDFNERNWTSNNPKNWSKDIQTQATID